MWKELKRKKSSGYKRIPENDFDEICPILPHQTSTVPEQTDFDMNYLDNTKHNHTNATDYSTTASGVSGLDVDLDSIGEFEKITEDVYVSNSPEISVDLLKSIGFNSIMNISSFEKKSQLSGTDDTDNAYFDMVVGLSTVGDISTHDILDEYIQKGINKPKVLINFVDKNIMIIVMSYYIIKHGLGENNFLSTYANLLDAEYVSIRNKLVPELDNFQRDQVDQNFATLVSMFPNTEKAYLKKLYGDYKGNLEHIVNQVFS